VTLVRVPRTLPKILQSAEVDRLVAALRTDRDTAMVLAGLRRCEVLGLRMADVLVGDRRLFVDEGQGGHQRVVPVAGRFLQALGDYLHDERPATGWSRPGTRARRRSTTPQSAGTGSRSSVTS